jgi:RNA polymerase sigma-70 factor (ECF subfamily)
VLTPEELARLWNQHADRLLLIVRGFGEPAEDAVQEAFVRLAAQKQPPDEPLAWLIQVARNQLLQWWRSDKRRQSRVVARSQSENWFYTGGFDIGQLDANQLDDQLDAQTVSQALRNLPLEKRAPVMMHIWGGLNFEQIAKILGTSRSTAHRQYTAAMDELKKIFADPETKRAPIDDSRSTQS